MKLLSTNVTYSASGHCALKPLHFTQLYTCLPFKRHRQAAVTVQLTLRLQDYEKPSYDKINLKRGRYNMSTVFHLCMKNVRQSKTDVRLP